MTTLREQAEKALRDFQQNTGLQQGQPNLYPGSAARIVSDFWEPLVRDLLEVLILSITVDEFNEEQDAKLDGVYKRAKEALS